MLHIVYGADASTGHHHDTVSAARACETEAALHRAVQAQIAREEQDARDEIFAEMRAEMEGETGWLDSFDEVIDTSEYADRPYTLCAM